MRRLTASIIKTSKENLRNWKVLALALLFSPFFIFLMKLFYGGSATIYKVGILNYDTGISSIEILDTLKNCKNQDGSRMFKLISTSNKNELSSQVKEKEVDIGVIIPEDYSQKLSIKASNNPTIINFYGCTSNYHYTIAAVMINDIINKQGLTSTKTTLPSTIAENFVEKKQALNEFEGYVPGLISLAVLMILLTSTASIVNESDKKTILRLKLSNLGAFNFLAGQCIVQAFLALAAIVLSYFTALMLGYRPAGNFTSILIVGAVSSLSMVAVSLIAASFFNTIFDILTIGMVPFFIMMFFSGSMSPAPKISLFTIGNHSLGITDILPLTHTVNAFNKILNSGADVHEVAFDIFMITLLTIIYFVLGLIIYNKRKFSKA